MTPEIREKLVAIRHVSRELRKSSFPTRQLALETLSQLIRSHRAIVLERNREDIEALGPEANSSFRDRLTLTPERLELMSDSLEKVHALADPLGEVTEQRRLANGLLLKRVRSPLGVVFMIFEARPNVITEAFSLALKSGNALIMRGGAESLRSSEIIYNFIHQALTQAGLPQECFWGITHPQRELSQWLMTQDQYIDVLVPRGVKA